MVISTLKIPKPSFFTLLRVITLTLLTFAVIPPTQANTKKTFKISVIHSYNEDYPAYEEFNKLLAKELKQNGIKADLDFFYLDCEQYNNDEELQRSYDYIESASKKGVDLFLTNDDQGTYSALACGHPYFKQVPILFSGVNFPNWKLLKKYDNVTGIWDKPDYLHNIEMVEQLMGPTRIRFFHDNTFLGREVIKDIAEQIKEADKETSDLLLRFIQSGDSIVRERNLGRDAENVDKYTQRPDSTTLYFSNLRDEIGRNILWSLADYVKYAVFVQTKHDYRTMRIGRMSSIPIFSAISEGVGEDNGMLGGYFSPVHVQAEEQAILCARILLNGEKVEDIPIKISEKRFVVDYEELRHWKIPVESIPAHYEIINMPFHIKYPLIVGILAILLIIILISSVIYPSLLYLREAKWKRAAQLRIVQEREITTFAMDGSGIYIWKYNDKNERITFDKEFFDSLSVPEQSFDLIELIELTHPNNKDSVFNTFNQIKDRVLTDSTVTVRCDFNGKGYQWYEMRMMASSESLREMTSIVGLIKSIQEYKEREEELVIARDLAAQAELKQSFLANMSHEIRTPLNAIVGFSNILASDEDISEEEKMEFINTINLNCDFLLKLVNDILELSRIESGNMSFEFEPCNVNKLLSDIYQTHSLLIPGHLEFFKELPEESLYINTDPSRLTQILTNFLNNATKFTAFGYIKLGYRVDKLKKEVCIYVEDTGKGIPEEEQKMIFERFYKQDEFAQGTGLGLSISQIIAERLNGRISLSSIVGKGSEFSITIPYNPQAQKQYLTEEKISSLLAIGE